MHKDFTFFQQAMLCIIDELDFEKSLLKTFRFMRQHFPLEAITIDQYSSERGGILIFCVVTEKGVFHVRHFVPLAADANHFMRKRKQSRAIINMASAGEASITKAHSEALQQFFPLEPRGYLVGYLTMGNTWLGDLVLVGTRPDCFTRRHEHLMGMLLPPMAMAINNRMRLQTLMASKKETDEERDRLRRELRQLSTMTMVGTNGGLKGVMDSIQQLRGMDTPVLILGETGTGKELVANAIQSLSRRSNARFIRVNCGALPESLLDSELFGYERGSFTGAEKLKTGRFEQANGGTLFLDEVGELSLSAQVRLLRVLQDGLVERLGSTTSTPVDVRVIAATNKDLSQMRREGSFREDLFHRLNVFPIRLPPLRERPQDIPLLVRHFVDRLARRMEIAVPPILDEGLEKACLYHWPGNVRELENIVERTLLLKPSGPVDISRHLPLPQAKPLGVFTANGDGDALRRLVDQRIAAALGALATSGNADSQGTGMWKTSQSADGTGADASAALSPMTPLTRATADVGSCEPNTATPALPLASLSLDAVMAAHIRSVVEHCRGKIAGRGGAAEILGLHHSTLRHKMRKLGISAE